MIHHLVQWFCYLHFHIFLLDFQLNKKSAVTLGKFDGIHTGHQKLIEIVRKKADEENQ